MLTLNKEDLAWAAGFFDGEGCTYLQRSNGTRSQFSKTYLSPSITINQKNHEVLEKFNQVTGSYGKFYFSEIKNQYNLRFSSFEKTQYIICLLWPWLGTLKRDQYRRILKEYLENRKNVRSFKPKKV